MSTSSPSPSRPSDPDLRERSTEGDRAVTESPVDVEQPAPKSPYARMTKQNTSVRNIVWALSLTMAVVLVVAVLFFGVGNDLGREVPETSRLDVTESADRAQDSAQFPVSVPELGEGWTAREARFDAAADRWEVRYTAPDGSLVTMIQSQEVDAPMLSAAVPGATVTAEVEIDGASCQELRGDSTAESEERSALSCAGEGWGILVHGADIEQVRPVAEAAIADLRADEGS